MSKADITKTLKITKIFVWLVIQPLHFLPYNGFVMVIILPYIDIGLVRIYENVV